MRRPIYISGIAYSLGKPQLVKELVRSESLQSDVLERIASGGLVTYLKDDRPLAIAFLDSMKKTLEATSMLPGDISFVLYNINNCETTIEGALFECLENLGIDKARVIGVSGQYSSVSCSVLSLAYNLISVGVIDNILVMLTSRIPFDGKRVDPDGATVSSDGVTSFIISSQSGQYEVVSAEFLSDVRLQRSSSRPAIGRLSISVPLAMDNIKQISQYVISQACISIDDVNLLFGTNGNSAFLRLIGEAASVRESKVYMNDLPRFAHLAGLDNIISLKSSSEILGHRAGDYFLMLNWAQHVFSAALVRCTKSTAPF